MRNLGDAVSVSFIWILYISVKLEFLAKRTFFNGTQQVYYSPSCWNAKSLNYKELNYCGTNLRNTIFSYRAATKYGICYKPVNVTSKDQR